MVVSASGSEASQKLIDAVFAHTEGNPFFMSEVIRLLSSMRHNAYTQELARVRCDYADGLLGTNSESDRQNAMSLLAESQEISTQMGMKPLTERVVLLQERAESLSTGAPAYPDGLTRREVELLGLVAAGKTDREIAEELVISVRTVTTHVSNILNKTGTANRTEATAYAIRQGLA